MYLVKVSVDLGDATEDTDVCVAAANAEQAGLAACVHCQIAPSMAVIDVRRIKGNCYGVTQKTKPKPGVANRTTADGVKLPFASTPQLRDAEAIQSTPEHRPKLIRRVVEARATIYTRTDSAAWVGFGKAVEEYGRRGRWVSEYCELDQMDCREDEERKPKNTRVEEQAAYAVTRIYRN